MQNSHSEKPKPPYLQENKPKKNQLSTSIGKIQNECLKDCEKSYQ
jgi:hypothetical protein